MPIDVPPRRQKKIGMVRVLMDRDHGLARVAYRKLVLIIVIWLWMQVSDISS